MKKIKLTELSVKSFITSLSSEKLNEIKGGDTLATCTTTLTRDIACPTSHCEYPSQRHFCPTANCTTIIDPSSTIECVTDLANC